MPHGSIFTAFKLSTNPDSPTQNVAEGKSEPIDNMQASVQPMKTSHQQKEEREVRSSSRKKRTIKTPLDQNLPPLPKTVDESHDEGNQSHEGTDNSQELRQDAKPYVVSDRRARNTLKKMLRPNDPHANNDAHLAYDTKLEESRTQIEIWKAAYQELQQNFVQYDQILKVTQNERDEALAINERTKQSAGQMQKAMDNKELFLGPQMTDDDIQTKFKSLISSIKTWSSNFLGDNLQGPEFSQESVLSYVQVLPLCPEIRFIEPTLAKKKNRRLFVRGWTAYVISDLVLRTLPVPTPGADAPKGFTSADLWLEENVRSSLLELETRLFYDKSSHAHTFNDWRAFTIDLLSKTYTDKGLTDNGSIQIISAAREIMSFIGVWASPERHDELEDGLIAIFEDAIWLSQLLRRQRALWYVRFPRPIPRTDTTLPGLLLFDPATMTDEWSEDTEQDLQLLRQRYVEIVVSPALFKRGNVDGERYDVEYAAVPASVLLRAPTKN
ncbi:uncharacterized protein BDZ99DRAFT_549751 [Mytilinidion resinicola]|uniref:Uncharacterized protein n=1 Tax=Mytilinidion resinicola TaxID=574789 RepID=A0A6A6Z373_9PEZI|nr:uncharacterized protein BDZ99DRAFT_549751 [Mytilinidion resinicola]KAF2815179.1 hypothetical protein BDZ99DRAFT_549751 [Mytilinidion resinicola]